MTFIMTNGTGFEPGSLDVIPAANRAGTVAIRSALPNPKTGNYYINMGGAATGGSISFIISGSPTEYYLAAANYPDAYWTSNNAIRYEFITGDATITDLRWNSTTKCFDLYVNNVLASNGTIAVTQTAWNHIQIYAKIDAVAGIIQTKIDGILDIDFAGDTQPGASTAIAEIRVRKSTTGGGGYVDDVVIGTGGWPGEWRADAVLVPDSDDSVTLVPSAGGDNYAMVDEVPPSDADYVYLRTEFDVTITDNIETISNSFQSGEVFVANGGAVPSVNDRFRVNGAGDFIGDELATAKGAALVAGDIFEVTNNGIGTEAVSWIDRQDLYTLTNWDDTDKVARAVVVWVRALKDEAVDHKISILIDDGSLTVDTAQSILTAATYIKKIMNTPPTALEWNNTTIDALKVGVQVDIA